MENATWSVLWTIHTHVLLIMKKGMCNLAYFDKILFWRRKQKNLFQFNKKGLGLFKVNNRKTRRNSEIYKKLTTKTPD